MAFSRTMNLVCVEKIATEIPVPKAVLVVSAHWFTSGTHVTAMDFRKTIHDFGGFPQELFDVHIPHPATLAGKETASLVHSAQVGLSHRLGSGPWCTDRNTTHVSQRYTGIATEH